MENPWASLLQVCPESEEAGLFLRLTRKRISMALKSLFNPEYTKNIILKNEEEYSLPVNKTLTNDFGIYFICNDRGYCESEHVS